MSHTPTPPAEYVRYIHQPTVYSIGDRFPFENPRPGTEGGGLITHTGFMGVAFWSSDTQKDQALFEDELALVALWQSSSYLPFLVMHFPCSGLTCDLFFNPLLMHPDGRELWADADAQYIMLYLIDERTNALVAWRSLSVPFRMSQRIRNMAQFYWDHDRPGLADELTRRAELIMSTRTGERMLTELSTYDLNNHCAWGKPAATNSTTDEKEQQ